jgi:putative PEP-CTERM system TPR-repeat lipoprotein
MQVTGELGRFVRALEVVRRDDPKAIAPRLALVRTYLGQGLAERALPIAREVVAIAPGRPDALEMLGTVELAAGRNSEALTTLRQLVNGWPRSSRAQARLAEAQARLGDLAAAEVTYRKALALEADAAEAVAGLARLYGQQQRIDEALALANAFRARYPKSAVGHVLLGDLLVEAKRYTDAGKAYADAFALAPSGDLVVKRHVVAAAAGEVPGDASLMRWLSDHPNDFVVRMHLANQRYRAGRYRESIEHYQAILAADPDHVFAMNNLASAYLKLNDARALTVAEAAHALNPEDPSILDTLGVAQTRYGEVALALDTFGKALARRPDATDVRVNYALALARSGDKAAAREELQRVLNRDKAATLAPEARALLDVSRDRGRNTTE